MTLRDFLFSLVDKFKRNKIFGGGQANSDEGIYRVLYKDSNEKSYSILDAKVSDNKISFCETWGGPKIEDDFGDFDVEWFVTISGWNRTRFIKKLCRRAKVPVIEKTENQAIVDLIEREFGNQASSITPLKNWLDKVWISYQFDRW